MKEQSPTILILGGGVAGLAAARSLKNLNLSVHLVEKQDHLGGKTALWACMATDICKDCGACLSYEMAQQAISQDNLTIHLKTKINTLKKTDQGVEVLLTSGKTIIAAKVIMATGFSVFDPARLPSLHSEACKNVITTAQLNTRLMEKGPGDLFGDKQNPRIAFIQCVGSRNRELKKDYCSQVCCKISMRHAQKLIHEIPGTQITLFYMDLQIIGKETRQMFQALSQQIDLVQGVPAEILEDPDTRVLTMVTEDAATQSRIASQFDLVVLSVGMESPQDLEETAALMEVRPNDWGFFNTRDAVLSDDILIAGCATGPKDILSSIQEGKVAGAKALKDLGLAGKPDINVAVLGNGPQADMVAKTVSARGYPVYALGDSPDIKILAVDGTNGNFAIYYENQGKKETLTCGAIIAAPEPCTAPNAGMGDFQTAMDLNLFAGLDTKDIPEKSLILLDYFAPEFKTASNQALTAAVAARKAKKEITIVMNKMLVHSGSGQRLYDQARKSGIQFLRFNTPEDIEIRPQNHGFHITIKEATLSNIALSLECDCLVLPESISPCPGFKTFTSFLHTPLDREGFLQPANVRHRLTHSPKKGIFFAGTCHDEVDAHDLEIEIQEILASLDTRDTTPQKANISINKEDCAKCLTCYRICPHGAIILNGKMQPQIMQDACFSCHLCVSNCPAQAIESEEVTNDQITGLTKDQVKDRVVIFACERSASLAAGKITLPEKTQIIILPCASRISSALILKSLINGASKVIVSGCHEGNCQSMEGSTTAGLEVDAVAKMPGIIPGQVAWEPVAANEAHKFQRIISKAHKGNSNNE